MKNFIVPAVIDNGDSFEFRDGSLFSLPAELGGQAKI